MQCTKCGAKGWGVTEGGETLCEICANRTDEEEEHLKMYFVSKMIWGNLITTNQTPLNQYQIGQGTTWSYPGTSYYPISGTSTTTYSGISQSSP